MKSTQFTATLFFLIGMFALNTTSQSSVPKIDERTASILNTFRADYSKSMLDGQTDRLQRYFSDTIRLMPPFQKTLLGKANASSYFRAFTQRFKIHTYTRNEIEILDLGPQLLEIGTITMRMTLNATGKEFNIAAKYLNLWVKTPSGEPRLLTEAWNNDQYDAEFQEQLKFDDLPGIRVAFLPNVPVTTRLRFELAAFNRLLDETVTHHDGNTWTLFYADDAKLMASYKPICNGKMEVDAYIQQHVKELPTFEGLDIRNDRIDDLGKYIIEYASHVASWKNSSGSGVNTGKNIRIWLREPNLPLQLFRSISMYD